MNSFNSLTNPNSFDHISNTNSPNHKQFPLNYFQPQQQSTNNLYQSGNFENENYRFVYNNPHPHQMSNSGQNKNSIFLTYLQTKKSNYIGPVLMNVCCSSNDGSGDPFTIDFNFINPDNYINETQNKIYHLKEIQTKFESLLSTKNIFNKNKFNDFQEFMSEMYENDSLKFQVVQLPFDQFQITTDNSTKTKHVESSSQTTNLQEKFVDSKIDYLNFMRQEIQLLKEQNQLLKHQLEIKSKESLNTPMKEYVLRKNSSSTKESRNPSATSTVINIDSHDSRQSKKFQTASAKFNKNETSFIEILQEYMLENEALRLQNDSLNEQRVRYHSEIELVFKQNQSLTEKVKELTRQISQISVRNSENIAPESINFPNEFQKENLTKQQNQSYPIMYEKQQFIHENKNSYLKQYDTLMHKLHSDMNKKSSLLIHQNERCNYVYIKDNQQAIRNERNLSPERSINNIIKSEINQSTLNDSLREELGRIDNTIKEHIRKNQFNNTLRNMGVKHNLSRK